LSWSLCLNSAWADQDFLTCYIFREPNITTEVLLLLLPENCFTVVHSLLHQIRERKVSVTGIQAGED